jgi:hypothetical protein
VTDTLNTVQTISGTNLTITFLTSLLSPSDISSAESQLTPVLSSGQLCTGCVQNIYEQAIKANASIAQTSLAQSLVSQSGSNFSSGTPTGVSAASTSTASTASASSSAKSAAGHAVALGSQKSVALGSAGMIVLSVLGGALVL